MQATRQLIPWQDQQEWSQVILSVSTAVKDLGQSTAQLYETTVQICDCYTELDRRLDHLGAMTCCSCTTICCNAATVWYDLKDLLFLYLSEKQLPRQQITKKADRTCAYLTPQGCCISRQKRPFICTWYICAAQKSILKKQHKDMEIKIFLLLDQLKEARNKLEVQFVNAIC